VLAVVDLVYTAGLTDATGPCLCAEAIRLARILAALLPDEPEVAGLLALLLLTESRRPSRTRPDGSRSRCLRGCQPDPFSAELGSGTSRTWVMALWSTSSTSSRQPSTSTVSPLPGMRPIRSRTSPATVA
jgi:Family of unknown function (DUF6596)